MTPTTARSAPAQSLDPQENPQKPAPPDDAQTRAARMERIRTLQDSAYRIRRHALDMGEIQGQGYIGQALGVADVLAVVYKDVLNYLPDNPEWPKRDRFLLSIGHYAIALYAALAEAGVLDTAELDTYGADGSRLPMSGMASYTPGMEISGGSLGHGLGIATGMALGLRHQGSRAHVYNLLSDGELDEGSTWEAALACAHHGLDNVTAIVDVNALQADGPTRGVLRTEPVTDKWAAFGWHTIRVDGNDIEALVSAFDELRAHRGSPAVLVCDTRIGRGVPLLETREKAHFMRVEPDEWQIARDELAQGHSAGGQNPVPCGRHAHDPAAPAGSIEAGRSPHSRTHRTGDDA
ncbi:transketolase [Streptomyces sp. NPDC051662]|uniref:transketolase n=1 Tax=Streptomyces sp. NPDC051662 TaxID=3154750 RepID=UPI00342F8B0F